MTAPRIYIAERKENTISVWSADSPNTHIEDLFPRKPNTLGAVDDDLRKWLKFAGVTRDQILAEPCVAPEGLTLHLNAQGEVIVTWGALAQAQARWVNATTKQWGVAIGEVPYIVGDVVGQTHFVHLTRSDGSFLPEGTLLTATGDNQSLGRPLAWLPSPGVVTPVGSTAGPTPVTHSQRYRWAGYCPNALSGTAAWSDNLYPFASRIANGMLFTGGSGIGMDAYVKAAPGAPLNNQSLLASGRSEFMSAGDDLIDGNYAWGFIDKPLRWGASPGLDAFYIAAGHVRPSP